MPDVHNAVGKSRFPHAVDGKGDGLRIRKCAFLAKALDARLDNFTALDAAPILRIPFIKEIIKARMFFLQLCRRNS